MGPGPHLGPLGTKKVCSVLSYKAEVGTLCCNVPITPLQPAQPIRSGTVAARSEECLEGHHVGSPRHAAY